MMKTIIDHLLPSTATNETIHASAVLIFFAFYFGIKTKKMFSRRGRGRLLKRNTTITKIKKLPWEDFERLCVQLFESQGWKAEGNSKKGSDGGVDIWLSRRRKRAIVQCKKYGQTRVTVQVLRELWGLKCEHEVDKVFVVTSSIFTKECFKFIHNKNIELIDGETLVKLIKK